MKEQLEYIPFKIPKHKKEQLEKYANKHHNGNVSMAIREFIDKGLAINSYSEEITFLRQMINEELETTLDPYMNRLIAICSKGAIMSASSHFALGDALSKFVEPRYRVSLEEALTENKKKGYVYIISKDHKVDKL
ncbi:hypothetical protein [uncultured Tyzzerella sp.]|uniref:hypothetical protein n=1 Tax=uncultured Tyzzerella sp. TaxID=2321398 RepID=UPI002943C301|nr:hypothetical protein [uncultured Tyzzerella sp.]